MQSVVPFKVGKHYWNGRGNAILVVATNLAGTYPICGVHFDGHTCMASCYQADGKFGLTHTSDFDLKDEITGVEQLDPENFLPESYL